MNLIKNVLILGDSLLKRVLYDEKSQRFSTLQDDSPEKIEAEFNLKLINKSKMGCTIDKGWEILHRVLPKNPADYILLEYGGNDCDYLWHEITQKPQARHYPKNEPHKFQEILHKMVEFCQSQQIKPILCTLPPIIAEWYFNRVAATEEAKQILRQWLEEDIQIIYRAQELYSRLAEQLAQKLSCPLIDFRSAFLQERNLQKLYCADGIHPNSQGHQLMYQTIQSFCRQYLAV